jgi:hypothetical protein
VTPRSQPARCVLSRFGTRVHMARAAVVGHLSGRQGPSGLCASCRGPSRISLAMASYRAVACTDLSTSPRSSPIQVYLDEHVHGSGYTVSRPDKLHDAMGQRPRRSRPGRLHDATGQQPCHSRPSKLHEATTHRLINVDMASCTMPRARRHRPLL